jgi:hypothetical protein
MKAKFVLMTDGTWNIQVSVDDTATDCPIGSGFIISLCAANLSARVVGAVIIIESQGIAE